VNQTSEASDAFRVCIEGEFTIYRAAELKAELLDALQRAVAIELDLTNVSELDSAGVQLLLLLKRQATAQGVVTRIVGQSPAVSEVFALANLSGYLGEIAGPVAGENQK